MDKPPAAFVAAGPDTKVGVYPGIDIDIDIDASIARCIIQ